MISKCWPTVTSSTHEPAAGNCDVTMTDCSRWVSMDAFLSEWHWFKKFVKYASVASFSSFIIERICGSVYTNILSNKRSKYAGILNKLENYLHLYMYVMRSLYFNMVGSALNYGLLTWGFTCSRLTKIQKWIIRTITCSKYNSHTEPLLKALDILKIEDTLKLNTLKFYYKYTHGTLPSYFYTYNIETQGASICYVKSIRIITETDMSPLWLDSSLSALVVVRMTTSSAVGDEGLVGVARFQFSVMCDATRVASFCFQI